MLNYIDKILAAIEDSKVGSETKRMYRRSFKIWCQAFNITTNTIRGVVPNKTNYNTFATYLYNLEKPYTLNTFRRVLYNIHSAFLHFHNSSGDHNYRYDNFTTHADTLIEAYKKSNRVSTNNPNPKASRAISTELINKMLKYLSSSDSLKDMRLHAYILIAKYTGLHTSDILKLQLSNLTFANNSLSIECIESKSKKTFTCSIGDTSTITFLSNYIQKLSLTSSIFPPILKNGKVYYNKLWRRESLYMAFCGLIQALSLQKARISIISFRKRLISQTYTHASNMDIIQKHFGWISCNISNNLSFVFREHK